MVYVCFQAYGPGIIMIIICEAPVIATDTWRYISGLLLLYNL